MNIIDWWIMLSIFLGFFISFFVYNSKWGIGGGEIELETRFDHIFSYCLCGVAWTFFSACTLFFLAVPLGMLWNAFVDLMQGLPKV